MACAPSEDSDQPESPPSLIRVFAVRKKKACVLSYPLSAQRRLWSDWADAKADLSLHWAHSHFVGFVTMRLIYKYWIKIPKQWYVTVFLFFFCFCFFFFLFFFFFIWDIKIKMNSLLKNSFVNNLRLNSKEYEWRNGFMETQFLLFRFEKKVSVQQHLVLSAIHLTRLPLSWLQFHLIRRQLDRGMNFLQNKNL